MSKQSDKDWDRNEDYISKPLSAPAESKNSREDSGAKDSFYSDDYILEQLQKFIYEDETLAHHFETFIDRNSHIMDLSSEEYKLQYTEVFNEYKALFENKLEDFITNSLKVTIHDVYKALKRKVDSGEDSMESFFAQVLIAVTDFDVFISMMRDSARKQSSHK